MALQPETENVIFTLGNESTNSTPHQACSLSVATCYTKENLVVSIQNVYKSYTHGAFTLSNLSMAVKKGSVYGLLGSSGCGKTTLLNCIVGQQTWDSGQILLFNRPCHRTPGRRVGFMPQDIALHEAISIKETVNYFGRLYGLSKNEIKKQWQWLIEFLLLPSKPCLVKDLSGGQKRRVSLAVAVLHKPELLILDEPTVGMDPLLRKSIWEYLEEIVESQGTTVLVTTHYIEELRNSDTVGVLRNGRMMFEESPAKLLQRYQCDLLEEAVLQLCRANEALNSREESSPILLPDVTTNIKLKVEDQRQDDYGSGMVARVTALSTVIGKTLLRHIVFLMMVLILPTSQIVLTLLVLGSYPRELQIGVVNPEADCFFQQHSSSMLVENWSFQGLSCSLVTQLSQSGTLILVPTDSTEGARELVRQGKLMGYVYFPNNYSQHMADFLVAGRFAENDTLHGSRVHLTLDMSEYLAASITIHDAFQAYEHFLKSIANNRGLNAREFEIPMEHRDPVFGESGSTFPDYYIPVIIIAVIFEMNLLMTSVMFINDKKQGTLNRGLVAGLRFHEVMISYLITQMFIVAVQSFIYVVVLRIFYHVHVSGSHVVFLVLCALGGISAQALGLLLGVIFQHEAEALLFGMLIILTLTELDGALWPVEGMLSGMRPIAYSLPTTYLVESVRAVTFKGAELLSPLVWKGVAVSFTWTLLFWIVALTLFFKMNILTS